jgi:protein-L-isoaspartate(D-aspartate) O-methyltransferase
MPSSATMRNNMMLGQLLTNDITDTRILDAMGEIPREPFVPEHLRGAAYADEDLHVGNGRYLMEPLTFAQLLDLAEINPTNRILNIGCLTGYTAAILAKLATHIVAIDTDEIAIQQARDHMQRLNISNVNVQHVKNLGDGYIVSSPYNVIVIQGAVNFIPDAVGDQLAEGGRLVTVRNIARRPDIKGGLGKGLLVTKIDGKLQYREHFDASCPLLPGFEQASGFVF